MSLYRALMFGWALSWSLLAVQGQENTTCKDGSSDWYTSVVGETPCKTYQSLRLLCRDSYTLPILGTLMTAASPGFQCDEAIYGAPQDCCCNSIAYALGVLCINCQQGTGFEQDSYSEPPGAYTTFLDGCSPSTDGGFTATAQNLVCGTDLKIDDQLYFLFWDNGQWLYEDAREAIIQGFVTSGNNSFTHCASSTVKAPPPHERSALSGSAIGGIAIAAAAGLAFAMFIIWYCVRRYSRAKYTSGGLPDIGMVDRQIHSFSPQPMDALMSDAPAYMR
ncbi:hypothetical protein FIBSPDRAFT_936469 [Athelia psychrophila]|uniref:Mid2 domain-containing protein n=1 Tax=Athelia psychrophila TaxID=1759441 RepID=A0A166C1N1_9AGAM|nr:hypothetical protein FIBSPDRAFT_936469 [Fibularhizoctonia sp. CBS 109695]